MKIRGNPDLDVGAVSLPGGPVGCLLLHGLTGSPPEMSLLGAYLHGQGMSVAIPLLAGHGTRPEELQRVRWQDWVLSAETAWNSLKARCELVFVGGLSLGSLLACHMAALHPEAGGLMAYSPAVKLQNRWLGLAPVLKPFVQQWPKGEDDDLTDPLARTRTWHYASFPTGALHELTKLQRVIRRELPGIRMPLLVVHSTGDTTIAPDAAVYLCSRIGSEEREMITLHNSGHNLLVDTEREAIFARTYGFIAAHAGGRLRKG